MAMRFRDVDGDGVGDVPSPPIYEDWAKLIFDAADKATGRLRGPIMDADLVNATIQRETVYSAAGADRTRIKFKICAEELVARGYEKIFVVVREAVPQITDPTATQKMHLGEIIDAHLAGSTERISDVVSEIDIKEGVSGFELEKLSRGEMSAVSEGLYREVITETIDVTPVIPAEYVASGATTYDRGLSIRAGMELRMFESRSAVGELSESATDRERQTAYESDITKLMNAGSLRDDPVAQALLAATEADIRDLRAGSVGVVPGHRTPPPDRALNEILHGVYDGLMERLRELHRTGIIIPPPEPAYEIIEKKGPVVMVKTVDISLPGSGKELSFQIYAPPRLRGALPYPAKYKTVPIYSDPEFLLGGAIVDWYKNEELLPSIKVAPAIEDNRYTISVTIPAGVACTRVAVYRRELGLRPRNDFYSLVTIAKDLFRSADSGSTIVEYTETLSPGKSYKYIAVPYTYDKPVPVFSEYIMDTGGEALTMFSTEPVIVAAQNRGRVAVSVMHAPSEARQMYLFRTSDSESKEILVDYISLADGGIVPGGISTLYDSPPILDQHLRYIVKIADDLGRLRPCLDKPDVRFRTFDTSDANLLDISAENVEIDGSSTSVAPDGTPGINLRVTFQAKNLFTPPSSEVLLVPDEATMLAATNKLNIVRIKITRVDLETGDTDVIANAIANPGINGRTGVTPTMSGLPSYYFYFTDNGESALSSGYTPYHPNRRYNYRANLIIYPLGCELRRVGDVKKIPGISEDSRLEYSYDPFIFDHPLYKNFGILPSGFNEKSLNELEHRSSIKNQVAITHTSPSLGSTGLDFAMEGTPRRDYTGERCIEIKFTIPENYVQELDHIQLLAKTNALPIENRIDVLWINSSALFTYYDYMMPKFPCTKIYYRLRGVSKSFETLFESQALTVEITVTDPLAAL